MGQTPSLCVRRKHETWRGQGLSQGSTSHQGKEPPRLAALNPQRKQSALRRHRSPTFCQDCFQIARRQRLVSLICIFSLFPMWAFPSQSPSTPPLQSRADGLSALQELSLPPCPFLARGFIGWKTPRRLWRCTSCRFRRLTCPRYRSGWPRDVHPGLVSTCGERSPDHRDLLPSTSVPRLEGSSSTHRRAPPCL